MINRLIGPPPPSRVRALYDAGKIKLDGIHPLMDFVFEANAFVDGVRIVYTAELWEPALVALGEQSTAYSLRAVDAAASADLMALLFDDDRAEIKRLASLELPTPSYLEYRWERIS